MNDLKYTKMVNFCFLIATSRDLVALEQSVHRYIALLVEYNCSGVFAILSLCFCLS